MHPIKLDSMLYETEQGDKTSGKMNIRYICPYWGQEHLQAGTFIDNVLANDFDGIEINLPEAGNFTGDFIAALDAVYNKKPDFIFIPQQLEMPENESVGEYISKVEKKLLELAAYRPAFINSHTGKDYYSFDDNCRAIEACLNISSKTGVKILHETHRGRFSFHAASLIPYLEKFPEMELTGDFSHFCTVSESLLSDQRGFIEAIIPHVSHIHARVGHEQGAQVNEPFAPEWNNHLHQFVQWWNEIIMYHSQKGAKAFFLCPECGPAPYMPALPFTQQPVANQWLINIRMKEYLKGFLNGVTT